MVHPQEVDVIVCGGGPAGMHPATLCRQIELSKVRTTGCVVAGRLAYADPNLKVMLIEGESSEACYIGRHNLT